MKITHSTKIWVGTNLLGSQIVWAFTTRWLADVWLDGQEHPIAWAVQEIELVSGFIQDPEELDGD